MKKICTNETLSLLILVNLKLDGISTVDRLYSGIFRSPALSTAHTGWLQDEPFRPQPCEKSIQTETQRAPGGDMACYLADTGLVRLRIVKIVCCGTFKVTDTARVDKL